MTVRKQGNSVGVAIPAETLAQLADGIKLVKRNLALEKQLAAAREVLREQADALVELATGGMSEESFAVWLRLNARS